MKRRDFLRAAGGSAAAAATAATGVASAQSGNETTGGGTATATGTATGNESTGNESTGTASGGGGGGGGPTKTVEVGPGGSLVFTPGTNEPLRIAPGTTVKFVWKSDNHNIVVTSQPDGSNWEGTAGGKNKLYNTGHTLTHTFNTKGTYEYHCQPHQSAGMVGTIEVVDNPNAGAGGGGEKDLEDLGVPLQAHWVGASTLLAILVSLVYTFYILKYGESPNTGNTGGK